MGNQKWTFDEIYDQCMKSGCEPLFQESDYVNKRSKLKFHCKCGRQNQQKSVEGFMKASSCRSCVTKSDTKLEDVLKTFRDRGCIPKFTEYRSANDVLHFTCACGNEAHTTYTGFLRTSGCKKCGGRKLSVEEVRQQFIERGCIPLFNNYTSQKQVVPYICACDNLAGRNKEKKIAIANFLNGQACRDCGNSKKRYPIEFVQTTFEEAGCKLISEYKNSVSLIEYVCTCGSRSRTNFNFFKNHPLCADCRSTDNKILFENEVQKRMDQLSMELIGETSERSFMNIKCKKCNAEYEKTWKTICAKSFGCIGCQVEKQLEDLDYEIEQFKLAVTTDPCAEIKTVGKWKQIESGHTYRLVTDENEYKFAQINMGGQLILCDCEDLYNFSNFEWFIVDGRVKTKKGYPLERKIRPDIAKAEHINGNVFDYRQANLRVKNREQRWKVIDPRDDKLTNDLVKISPYEKEWKVETIVDDEHIKPLQKSFSKKKYRFDNICKLAKKTRDLFELMYCYHKTVAPIIE